MVWSLPRTFQLAQFLFAQARPRPHRKQLEANLVPLLFPTPGDKTQKMNTLGRRLSDCEHFTSNELQMIQYKKKKKNERIFLGKLQTNGPSFPLFASLLPKLLFCPLRGSLLQFQNHRRKTHIWGKGGGGGWEGVAVPLPKQATQKAGRSLLANLLPPPQRRFFYFHRKRGKPRSLK